ncbi:hypothetical protein [Gracilimonas tropica]|uniref:hypothetical protein n=1 Tax=Gracilimonas tropica TaxID=454600 RepID=UPI0003644084|nr:hypothetical protein [Gracilimonas tropica]
MVHKNILLIIVASLFISCTHTSEDSNQKILTKFQDSIKLEAEPFPINEKVLGIIYLQQLDSLIIASTIQEDNLYWVLENEKVKANFGNTGNGPKEIPYPIHIYDTFKRNAFLYDSQLLLLSKVDVDASIGSGKLEIIDQYEFPKELSGIREAFFINEELIAGIYDDRFDKRLDEKRGVFFFHIEENSYELLQLNNIEITPYEVMPAININAKMPTLSPDRTKIALASVHNPILEIVDLEKRQVKELKIEGEDILENYPLEDFKDGEAIQYYTFISSTEKHLYLLCKGYSENNTEAGSDYYIQVYSWEGEPVNQYEVPSGIALSSFFVNEEDAVLIGHSLENGQTYKFKL